CMSGQGAAERFMRNSADPVNELLAMHATGRFAEMETCARGLLAGNPDAPILHELLGIALSAQDRPGDALFPLQEAVGRAPGEPQFWENLALCQRRLEQFAPAEESLRRSLALRPGSAATLNALGSVLRSLRRYEEASTCFQQALEID